MMALAASVQRTGRGDRMGRRQAAPRKREGGRALTPGAFEPYRKAPAYADLPPPIATRVIGLAGTGLIGLAVIGAGLVQWTGESSAQTSAETLTVIEISTPRSPPIPPSERPPGPERVAQERRPNETQRPVQAQRLARPSLAPMPIGESIERLSISPVSPPAPGSTPAPAPSAERTTSPEARALPPAPKASVADPEWEGLVLAALNRAKRYPRAARRKQQEGTSWIDFVIDRRGRVRSIRLERSSGVDVLDREALALAERAQPLPRPPESVGGERIRLLVPIEFFIR